ncbi:endonuclease/exonuclease/phosphatase family protein [Aquipuribacter sp. SD81]|uniref:endonuclease/exonuclease/phosphatase family protein n=1 Tax=Aquipuribacter sp. SD81 TaxID=3127703 RepID=UPI00301A9D76
MTRREHARRRAPAVAALALALVALPVTLARLLGPLGLDTVTPGAQLAGLAPLAGCVLAVALLLLVASLLPRPPAGRGRGARRAGALGALVLVAALVLHAGWALGPLVGGPRAGEGTTGVQLRVLALNARFGNAEAAPVVRLVVEHDVDVLAVTELTPRLRDALREAGLDRVLPHAVVEVDDGPLGSGTFSRWPLQELAAPDTTFTTVRARVAVPGVPAGVVLTTVHTWPPLPGRTDRWQRDHELVREVVATDPAPRVVAGDLNATPDHSLFRRLLDEAGLRPVGDPSPWDPTWPSDQRLGPFLRLDHVLVDDEVSVPGRREHLRVPGTDHLAVLATVEVGPAPAG